MLTRRVPGSGPDLVNEQDVSVTAKTKARKSFTKDNSNAIRSAHVSLRSAALLSELSDRKENLSWIRS